MSSDDEANDIYYDDDDYGDDFDGQAGSAEDESMSEPDAEGYDVLSPSIDDLPQKKPYDVTYKVRTVQEIMDMQNREVQKIHALLDIPTSTAAILLRHHVWNSEKLQEAYFTDPEQTLLDAGLSPPSSPSPVKRTRSQHTVPFECPICCMDFTKEQVEDLTLTMGCGHRFCRTCWTEYISGKIRDEGESARIQCMGEACKRIVRPELVDELVPGELSKKYHNLLNAAYVADSPSLRWCPHPGCEHVIECHQVPPRMLNQLVPTVKCDCGRFLCFGCGYAGNHRPVLCKIVKMWEKKCADDSETANWLQANTKECTKCQSTIEKNGGCNHMTCKKCKWEFCWVCMGPWSEHGTSWYQCNRFDEKSGIDARDTQAKSRASLERYLHYFTRYANHDQSAKLDAVFYTTTENRMKAMQTQGLSWIETVFMRNAVDTIIAARITLKYSYAMAFYLVRNNDTEIFESNQTDLEMAVENLSHQLETNPEPDILMKMKQDITNLSAYVKKRSDILLDDVLTGYFEGRWKFTVTV
ncbi:hypothetical protein BCR39DRAFT_563976 [Naematelia encephala]|uniref:RBR-type E3 ubiquitin transferase n=1 Tax=Naematelia encephala TaxID=71784 RepID=A0A1Y2BF66_9TREE|nr:hypothetical protein BCR39DRAFT_563976 [Naematelia encephala]